MAVGVGIKRGEKMAVLRNTWPGFFFQTLSPKKQDETNF